MKKRGVLTEKAKQIANDFLGRDITTEELRLYPYLQYVMMNEQKLEFNKIGNGEREIIKQLKKEGHVEGGLTGLGMTVEFWDYLHEILFETYVDIDMIA